MSQKQESKKINTEEFVKKVREIIMKKEWGSAVLAQANTIKIEVVRVSNTDDIMIRISGQKPGNALKLVTQEHLDNFIDLVRMIVENESGLMDKLEALKSLLREGGPGGAVYI